MLAICKVQVFCLNKELLLYLLIYSFSHLLIENVQPNQPVTQLLRRAAIKKRLGAFLKLIVQPTEFLE